MFKRPFHELVLVVSLVIATATLIGVATSPAQVIPNTGEPVRVGFADSKSTGTTDGLFVTAQTVATTPAPATVDPSTVDITQPAPVETVVVNQDVSIPYGQWIEDVGNIAKEWLIPTFLGLLSWVITRYVPLPLRALTRRLLATQAEQLLQRAIDYGINATAGATRNKTLEVHVANDVLRNATNYAIANGWPKLIDFMDGPDGIIHKIFARLPIHEGAQIESFGLQPQKPTATKVKQLDKKNQNIPWVLQK